MSSGSSTQAQGSRIAVAENSSRRLEDPYNKQVETKVINTSSLSEKKRVSDNAHHNTGIKLKLETVFILLTFPLSFQNNSLLIISLLTTFRHMFMVLIYLQ